MKLSYLFLGAAIGIAAISSIQALDSYRRLNTILGEINYRDIRRDVRLFTEEIEVRAN